MFSVIFDYRPLTWEREPEQAKRTFGQECISDTCKKRGKEGLMEAYYTAMKSREVSARPMES